MFLHNSNEQTTAYTLSFCVTVEDAEEEIG